ncbi:hypothetical protein GCM10009761_09630 [Agromyces terreus]
MAILAGGLVLGVGTALTLAAWNDSEFATGTFTAGSFNLEGSTDGTAYSDHAAIGDPAALDFSVGFDELSPGDVVTAPFAVRLDAGTDYDAIVTMTTADVTGDPANLTYRVLQTATFGCGDLTGATTLVSSRGLSEALAGVTFPLVAAPADQEYLCFEVTAGAGLTQDQSATATWQFAAESQ